MARVNIEELNVMMNRGYTDNLDSRTLKSGVYSVDSSTQGDPGYNATAGYNNVIVFSSRAKTINYIFQIAFSSGPSNVQTPKIRWMGTTLRFNNWQNLQVGT